MARVKFYSMRLDAEYLRSIIAQYNNDAEFKYLVFQQVNPDAPSRRDEYDLIGYIVGENWASTDDLDPAKLTRDLDNAPHDVNGRRVAFANYPILRTKLASLVSSGLVKYLLLKAEEYAPDPRYVSYKIIPKNTLRSSSFDQNTATITATATLTGDDDLNPCPPNQPSQG